MKHRTALESRRLPWKLAIWIIARCRGIHGLGFTGHWIEL